MPMGQEHEVLRPGEELSNCRLKNAPSLTSIYGRKDIMKMSIYEFMEVSTYGHTGKKARVRKRRGRESQKVGGKNLQHMFGFNLGCNQRT
jgi:hypothetical protein